jgi:UDP-N-acetylmuramate dehydrogenase
MIPATPRFELASLLGERILFDEPMSRHTSLRVGGPADALARPATRAELAALLQICSRHGLPWTLLGGGFNTLVQDAGLAGVVIQLKRLRALQQRSARTLFAEAGLSHASLTRFCVEKGLSGLEFGCGIPGTVGGWIAMNAGIGSREIEAAVHEIELMGRDGHCTSLPRQVLDFGYRELRGLAPGSVIVSALLEVEPSEPSRVRAEVDRLLARRAASQPLDVPSCGSVFRNPAGDFAGRLIEQAGLKGAQAGGARISSVHANFITNTGGATAADVLALIERARKAVREQFGVELETEVKILGRGLR